MLGLDLVSAMGVGLYAFDELSCELSDAFTARNNTNMLDGVIVWPTRGWPHVLGYLVAPSG